MSDIRLTPLPRPGEKSSSGARRDIRLTPPPRVAAPRPPASRPARGERARAWLTAAVFAVLLAAVVAVFVFLPRWVEGRAGVPPPSAPAESADPSTATVPAAAPRDAPEPPAADQPTEGSIPPASGEPPARPAPPPPDASPPRPAPSPRPAAAPGAPAARTAADPFVNAMTEGLAALRQEEWTAARAAFERANALEPGSPQIADGLARAAAGLRLETIAAHRERASILEAEERWRQAAAEHEAVLGLDPTVEFAREGKARCLERAELSDRLDFHLANPGRLSSAEVLEEAVVLLERASEVADPGPRLGRQIAGLGRLVETYSTPVRAVLRSDGQTEVVVYKVGRLGKFSRRELSLRPGSYTVVGSRPGFRDVRLQLVVAPGEEPAPLLVRCEEEI